MTYQPPLDQRIVDEYFRLASTKKTKDVAWLYGMVAAYGLKPEQLKNLTWNQDYSISLPSKKRSIKPVHPQWAFLFSLKEKQPCDLQSCLGSLCLSLYEAMAFQNVQLNITDLLLAHNLRKKHYRQVKRPAASYPAFAGAS